MEEICVKVEPLDVLVEGPSDICVNDEPCTDDGAKGESSGADACVQPEADEPAESTLSDEETRGDETTEWLYVDEVLEVEFGPEPCADEDQTQQEHNGTSETSLGTHVSDSSCGIGGENYGHLHDGCLQIHELYTDEKPYRCGQCDYATACISDLSVHVRIHTSKKPYKCSHCDYTSTNVGEIRAHKKTHSAEGPYKCGQCDYATTSLHDLSVHIRIHTGKKSYKCGQCDHVSTSISDLKAHAGTHSGGKPCKCGQWCVFVTPRKTKLIVREKKQKQTGIKSYKCSHCSYTTVHKGYLQVHERIHTGEKPYKCSQCSFASSQRGPLQAHQRKHAGEKPYKCGQCEYATGYKSSLLKHKKRHSGEKPHKCGHCNYATSQKDHLKRHEKQHKK